jgi:hypothetical protein
METGIIIKTPDDKKKEHKKNRTEGQELEDAAMNNINIMIYEGPKDTSKLRK